MRLASLIASAAGEILVLGPGSGLLAQSGAGGLPRSGWYIGGGIGSNWASDMDQEGWNRETTCYPTDACVDADPVPEISGYRWRYDIDAATGAAFELVATEAAGEGINLQCCHILFNYDIPWNPNRLEQRMGRIHRYGQRHDCLIFNFVATNTIEGRVLQRLLDKLQEIRDALDDDTVFNVVGEVLPSAHVERVLRDYYAGALGDADLEEQLLRNVDEGHFRAICQTALEGLASKRLNLDMLIERFSPVMNSVPGVSSTRRCSAPTAGP